MNAGAVVLDVEQAAVCLCVRMKSALYLALPQRLPLLVKPRLIGSERYFKNCGFLLLIIG
jgi:hypothetical protein